MSKRLTAPKWVRKGHRVRLLGQVGGWPSGSVGVVTRVFDVDGDPMVFLVRHPGYSAVTRQSNLERVT